MRALLPTPGAGSLPLPAGGLPSLAAAFEPRSVEDLNACVPDGAPQLRTAQPPQVWFEIMFVAVCTHPSAWPNKKDAGALLSSMM